ncbi:MAG: alkaline phosphatase family protein [Bryobacteraceae bacterium]
MLPRCIALAAAIALSISLVACKSLHPTRHGPKLIVLGVDGMDPAFVERHWNSLPNLARLRTQGHFGRLGTTTPPQSPVAWSTFITGLEPAEHGIFDFVHRDPQTLQPFSSMSRTEEPRWALPLGPYILPFSGSHVVSLRQGTAFWQLLSEHGVPVSVIRMPTNYPPVSAGTALSGMGTPDLRGTLGTFSFYTDDPEELSRAVAGGRIIKVRLEGGHGVLQVEGPPNALRKDRSFTSANLVVDVDRDYPVARLQIGENPAIIREGEWSEWITADFSLIPHLSSVTGIFRVFAKQLHPRFELYVSPINIDPISPALPIAAPSGWSRTIAHDIGPFFTMGTPEDTSALRQQVFTFPEFRTQTQLVFEDERRLLRYSLRHFAGGLLFFYFSSIDQNSHMLWGRHESELLEVYRAVDECIGEVRTQFARTELIVLSDHGFTTFDRAINLNTWLLDRGFLTLNRRPGAGASLGNVDWSSTEAYALGLNGLYLNLKNREQHGIVASGEQNRAIIAKLREQLLAWRDPVNGRHPVEAVSEVNSTPQSASVAPDLIVGYSPGYRGSWQTGLGETPAQEIVDNNDAWIGDHCINPANVPGVLFTSRKVKARTLTIPDVTASILNFFHVPQPSAASGHSFY